ncbi:MAG: hypothetical protein QME45_01360 [Clostridiales bacterium]|nr:hypothetical protein [Clostridiales bacterium]
MKFKYSVIIICLIFLMLPCTKVYAANTFEHNYIYNYWGEANKSLPAFEFVNVIDGSVMKDIKFSEVDDVFVSKDRIFLVDTMESRVNVFDTNFNFLVSIKLIRDANGRIVVNPQTNEQLMLTNPEGVFMDDNTGLLYIADTAAERIVVLDGKTYSFSRIIEKPDNMVGVTQFKPSKLVVGKDGVISIVVQGSYEGIIQLNNDGTFSRYFGLNKPKVNMIDQLWESIATRKQKEKMKKVFAPSFNNLTIDQDGLIYATTYDASAQNMVFRFDSKGENVLMENGYLPVTGDLVQNIESSNDSSNSNQIAQKSKFVDIAVSDFGVYALLDKTKGRVFIYDFEGDLLNIFGSSGDLKGNVKNPTGIAWLGKKLLISDKDLGVCYLYEPTEFGETVLNAAEQYYKGNWNNAGKLFDETVKLNANYDVGYTGVGRNYLMQDQYEKAMYYLKLGNSKSYYSKAYNGYRSLAIQKYIGWFAALFLLITFTLFYSEYKYNKKNG